MAKKFKKQSADDVDIVLHDLDIDVDIADIDINVNLDGEEESDQPIEEECAEEIDDLSKSLVHNMKQEAERFQLEGDAQYYFVMVFSSVQQKEFFLKDTGLAKYIDKGGMFLDARPIAKKFFGVDLPEVTLPKPHLRKPDKRYAALSGIPVKPTKPKKVR